MCQLSMKPHGGINATFQAERRHELQMNTNEICSSGALSGMNSDQLRILKRKLTDPADDGRTGPGNRKDVKASD